MLVTVLAAALRIHDLDRRSLTHLEMCVPGLPLPAALAVPPPRPNFAAAIKDTFSDTTYPPGYYAFMSIWTTVLGSSVRMLRLPSAIFGVLSVPFVFWIGARAGGRVAAWVAALLVAVNGGLVFWDQFARSVSLASMLGLAATWLLLRLSDREVRSRWPAVAYVMAIVAGAATHVFFWVLIVAHMIWTFAASWRRRESFPAAGTLQMLAVVIASPFLAFAAYQYRNPHAPLSANILIYAREFVQFGFLFPLTGFSSGVFPVDLQGADVNQPHLSIVRWAFVAISAVLFVAGILSRPRSLDNRPAARAPATDAGVAPRAWFIAAACGTLAIVFFIVMAYGLAKVEPNPEIRVTEVMTLAPFALAAFGFWMRRSWDARMRRATPPAWLGVLSGPEGLIAGLAVVPFVLLSIISAATPVMNVRNMTMLVPYVLVVLAWGIVRMGRRAPAAAILAVVIGAAHLSAFEAYHDSVIGQADYRAFAATAAPLVEDGDLVFVNSVWYTTPVYYYTRSLWPRLVGRDYDRAIAAHPRARVWLWLFYDENESPRVDDALAGYHVVRAFEIPGARAVLYESTRPRGTASDRGD